MEDHGRPHATPSRFTHRVLAELDFHYLVIAFVVSIICIGSLGAVREPMRELAIAIAFSPIANGLILALTFLGIAPWGFTKAELARCAIWIPTNLVAGSILTFVLLSTRPIYSAIKCVVLDSSQ